jgi:hypothetical protein
MKNEIDFDLFYSSFWVIPRGVNCICRRFGKLCSIFISWVNKKNNLEQIARAFLQVKVLLNRSLHQSEGGCGVSDQRNKLWRAPISSGDK